MLHRLQQIRDLYGEKYAREIDRREPFWHCLCQSGELILLVQKYSGNLSFLCDTGQRPYILENFDKLSAYMGDVWPFLSRCVQLWM